ncbi:YdcF family protein [Halomonas campisalis]|uniref:YdcF family protein n=1 Tax=Billgrantia campisalis TaxID=74661 RepID=A0ABS9P314_9GAMM|nr:YdcF family protein [Halomonas campisalis]MCG6656178.1 YdcF family protein [Halomonas campisalis]MDR5861364.1 YdcF family protein [Halomonas campisalis]
MSLLKVLLLPPTLNVLLVLLGLLLGARRLLGALLVIAGLFGLLLLATPLASHALRHSLEAHEVPGPGQLGTAQAIVILGGGRDYVAPEFGWGDAPANPTWRRLAYGAHLQRQTGLPILVSGGRVHDEERAEASLMAAALREVFEVPVQWLEGESRNTAENARFSAELLRLEDIGDILLVSQAWHLPRAVAAFEAAGLSVVAAPTEFASPPPQGLRAWLPRAYHLNQSTRALHEWLARGEQALREHLLRR